MTVVLTGVQTKQTRINIHKRNNIKNTVNTVYILPKHPHFTTLPPTHTHITKQVKTNTVQDIPKLNSHNITKYPQYEVTLMYMELLSSRTSP